MQFWSPGAAGDVPSAAARLPFAAELERLLCGAVDEGARLLTEQVRAHNPLPGVCKILSAAS